ncbi:MAG: hypothetical protein HKN15_11630 [Xanthomonadales bacterium]|nr:hypothetical protein [Xanthomonadales bacterium]
MTLFRTAFYWFIVLALILVAGFWKSYFSRLGAIDHLTHHFHAVAMLGWMALLIAQSWLIRNRKNALHRSLGKLSFIVAPAVVISGFMVTFYSQATARNPQAEPTVAIFWFGLFLAVLFATLYIQAIRHRKNMKLHARFMIATAWVFLLPGLARALGQYIAPLGIWTPTFYQMMWIPVIFGAWLLFLDLKNKQPAGPFLFSNIAWVVNNIGWISFYNMGPFRDFAVWSASNLG